MFVIVVLMKLCCPRPLILMGDSSVAPPGVDGLAPLVLPSLTEPLNEDERRLAQTLVCWLNSNRHLWYHPGRVSLEEHFSFVLDRSVPDRMAASVTCKLCCRPATFRVQAVMGARHWTWVTSDFNKHMKVKHCNFLLNPLGPPPPTPKRAKKQVAHGGGGVWYKSLSEESCYRLTSERRHDVAGGFFSA